MDSTRLPNSSEVTCRRLREEAVPPAELWAALRSIPYVDRDAWMDALLGIADVPDDGPDLPPGGVPYLPCSVNALLEVVRLADISSEDVFVDLGAGVGRAATIVHLLTRATAIGVEAQAALVTEAEKLVARLSTTAVAMVHGDAARHVASMTTGTVFFLYCPFNGERLARVLDALEGLAARRTLRVVFVDLPCPPRPWLHEIGSVDGVVAYRSA